MYLKFNIVDFHHQLVLCEKTVRNLTNLENLSKSVALESVLESDLDLEIALA